MGPLIFVLDNYDSFTYNLVQYLMELGAQVEVERNDRVTVDGVMARRPAAIVISPGPGRPESAGITLDLIARAATAVPLLGVCLGHQAIAQAFGGRIVRASRLMHGKTSMIRHDGKGVFADVSSPFAATRYHSLVVEPGSCAELVPSAFTDDGANEVIMGLRHREYPRVPLEGVQFHPESILTHEGKRMLGNFLRTVARC